MRELGAGVTLLDVDSLLREAPVRTLSELLTGRVPGIEVLQSSGTIGAGARILARGATSFTASTAPQIYVDGIRVDDDVATLIPSVGGQSTSRLDDINVEGIATIVILPGAAATALYGGDAANGVLLIATKRGAAGPPRFRAFTSQGLSEQAAAFPDNFLAVDATGAPCTAVQLASGACRLLRSNVLENPATSPFRHGYLRQYGLNAAGGGPATRFYVAGQWDGFGGVYGLSAPEQARLATVGALSPEVLNPNYLRRLNLRGNGQWLAGPTADVALAASYFSDYLQLPLNDTSAAGPLGTGLLASGLFGSADTSVAHGWGGGLPGDIFQTLTSQRITRVTASLAGRWQPLGFLTARAVVGLDLVHQTDEERPNVIQSTSVGTQGEAHTNAYTATVTAAAAYRLFGGTARSTAGFQHFQRRAFLFDSTGSSYPGFYAWSRMWDTTTTTAVFLEQQLVWNERLFLTAAVRRDGTTRGRVSDPAELYPHVGVAWQVPTGVGSIVGGLRVRAAYGSAGREAVFAGLKPERTREFEAGADAELLEGRLALGATVYDRRTSHVVSYALTPPSFGFGLDVRDSGEVSNKGIELTLSVRLVRSADVAWDLRVGAWGNRNRVLTVGTPFFPLNPGFGVFQVVQAGLPLGSYSGIPILGYSDLNHDGIVSPNEVQLGSGSAFLGTPLPTEGATLSSGVSLRRRLRVAALFEYRAGNTTVNYTELFRCEQGNCRARNDPTTPLADQVPWAAFQAGTAAGWVENASFLKLREVAVTVVAPAAWARRVGVDELRLTLAGRNLATWTRYRGLDPEVNVSGPARLSAADIFTQPQLRYWTARLDVAR